MNLQSELQNLKIWPFGGTSKFKILEIFDFKPIYVILIIYIELILCFRKDLNIIYMNLESELRNLKIWPFGGTLKLTILEILDFKPIYVILMYLDVIQIVY